MKLRAILSWFGTFWERILFYGSLVCLIFVLKSFEGDIARFSRTVEEDTQFLQRPERVEVLIDDAWVQRLTQWAQNGQTLAVPLSRDLFSITKEPKVEPLPVVHPEATTSVPLEGAARFELMKIYRQPVRLLFKGYLQLPDGSYSLQINWAGKTDFKQLGESIRGYRIEKFEKATATEQIRVGYTREVDKSYVVIRKDPDGPVTMQKGNLVTEKELFAKIFDKNANQVVVVHVGSQIGSYKVVDITEDHVLLSDQAKQEISLKRAR